MSKVYENNIPGGFADGAEERIIADCNEWVATRGLPKGEILFELVEPYSGDSMAILDLAWPDGIQIGLSQPVALLIGEDQETEEAVNALGYRFFNDIEKFKHYVEEEIIAQN